MKLKTAAAVTTSLTLLTGCGSTQQLISDTFNAELTENLHVQQAVDVAGKATAGLEVALIGIGLLTELPNVAIPEEAIAAADVALNSLLGDCLTSQRVGGEDGDGGPPGLDLTFAVTGCGIPDTPVMMFGALSLRHTAGDERSGWQADFRGFQIAGNTVNGMAALTVGDGESLDYAFQQLTVEGPDTATTRIDAQGHLVTNSLHTDVTFTGTSAVTLEGKTHSLTADGIVRDITTDCYPEEGTLIVGEAGPEGNAEAAITFEDGTLGTGLDSDDTGMVRVLYQDEKHIAQLPKRTWCVAF